MTDDPRRNAPPCPLKTCRAVAGDLWCYTPTGFRRHWHAARWRIVEGGQPKAETAAGALSGRRPSEAQHRILAWAIHQAGYYDLSGYTFHGDAQRRAAMTAMADPARGWFARVRATDHGTLYKITDAGRAAFQRYENWMNGVTG